MDEEEIDEIVEKRVEEFLDERENDDRDPRAEEADADLEGRIAKEVHKRIKKSQRPKRLWITQIIEYAIGFALASVAARSSTPLVPAVFSAVVIANAASVKATLSAFRITSGRIHQIIGVAIAVSAVIAAIVIDLDVSTRAMLIGLAGAEGFVSVRFGHGF
jgi:hypothetical protein